MLPLLLFLMLMWAVLRFQLVKLARWVVNETGDLRWRAWAWSGIEPIVTTILVLIVGFFAFAYAVEEWPPFNGLVYILTRTTFVSVLSLSLFSLFIYLTGQGSKPSRLAIGAIFPRLCLILGAYVCSIFNGNGYIIIGCLIASILLHEGFGLYQWHVLKTMVNTIPSKSKVDGLISAGDDEMWDEQVALIERLKAEEGMVEV